MHKVGCDMICRNHSARSDRDQFRICPTKLSKQELEDLYFVLVQNNLELKKTINGQEDRIKVLSTKVQRMSTTQKIFKPDGRKDCCVNTRAVANQQKEIIAELKRQNECMADRIRKLNMRLCSAKQFCKSATPRCLRCSSATSPYLIKQSGNSHRQQSQSTLKLALSCHNLSTRNAAGNKYTQTESLEPSKYENTSCEDNKCSTIMDELNQKIIDLQEEINRANEDYSKHSNVLQLELEQIRNENVRVRSEIVAVEHELLQREQKNAVITTSLRAAEGLSNELKIQLAIEKRKVVELETCLKAASMSNRVTESIENTLTSIQHTYTELSAKNMHLCDETMLSKHTEDSGYIDGKNNGKLIDDESLNMIIEELTKRILVLQTQVDALTISPPEPEKVIHSSIANEEISYIKSQPNIIHASNIKEHTNLNDVEKKRDASNVEIKPISPKRDNNSQQIPDTDNKAMTETKNTFNGNVNKSKEYKITESDTSLKEFTKTNVRNKEKNLKDDNDAKMTITKDIIVDNGVASGENNNNYVECNANFNETCRYNDDGIIKEKGLENDITSKIVSNNNVEDNYDTKKENNSIFKEKPLNYEIEKSKDFKTSTSSNDKTYNVREKDKIDNKNIPKENNEKDNPLQKKMLKTKTTIEKTLKKGNGRKIIRQKMVRRPESIVRKETNGPNVGSYREATYTLKGTNNSRPSSPDDTDYEISSMTDLSEERESKNTHYLLSPGEHMCSSTRSESRVTTDTTNYSLSEGEIPAITVRRRSNEDISRVENRSNEPLPKMEETLQEISEELARCERLYFSQRSRDHTMSALK